jgi:aminopeptidase N
VIDPGGDADPTAVVVNAGGSGFYRVRYAPERHRGLANRLDSLDVLERFNLLGDSWAVVIAQLAQPEDFLLLAEALGDEDDPDVWAQVTGALSLLSRAVDDDARDLVDGYARALVGPVLARLGWEPRPGEGPRTPTLRAQVVATLGTIGKDDEVRAQAHRLHEEAQRGTVALDPDLAAAILNVVGSSGGSEDYETFLEHYRHPTTPQEEMRYLYALASFTDPSLAARTFELALTEVRSQDAPFLIQLLLANRDNGPAAWARVVEHWDELVSRIPTNILPRMLGGVTALCRDPQLAGAIGAFVRAHPLPIGQRTVDQTLERLDINVSFAASFRATAADVLVAATRRLEKR